MSKLKLVKPNSELEFSPHPGSEWRKFLAGPRASFANAIVALTRAPEWVGAFAYDSFHKAIVMIRATPLTSIEVDSPVTTNALRELTCWMQHEEIITSVGAISEALEYVAQESSFSPLKNYLDSLSWDGTERIKDWLSDYLGVAESDYSNAIGRAWLISAVARACQPGCKADCCLVLEGRQGTGKSTSLEILASKEYYTDNVGSNLMSKDTAIACGSVWIVELAEFEVFLRGHDNSIKMKAFLSMTEDHYRPVYQTSVIRAPRQCVFAATTNTDQWLEDQTGGRRYWPVKTGTIKLERLRQDRDQLWAEAKVAYDAGEPWWLTDDQIEQRAKEYQGYRIVEDAWSHDIREYTQAMLRIPGGVGEILANCLEIPTKDQDRHMQMRVSGVLKRLGFEQRSRRLVGGVTVRAYERDKLPG